MMLATGFAADDATLDHLPLRGIRVLELGQIYNGPYAGFLMASAGADVVKIEPPGGERLRRRPPVNGAEWPFYVLNTNKRSVVIDLKTVDGRDRLLELATEADVLTENFSVGTMDRLGLGWDVLHATNPRLVVASSTGYDPDGGYARLLAMDLTVQAMSGLMSATGFPEYPPVRAGGAMCDFAAGTHLYGGILAALLGRERTGKGSRVQVAMIDAVLPTLLSNMAPFMMGTDRSHERTGNHHGGKAECPYNVYRAADGWVAIICVHEGQWQRLVRCMGREDITSDPRYATNRGRVLNVEDVDAIVEAWTAGLKREDIMRILSEVSVPVAPVRTLAEVVDDDQLLRSCTWQDIEQPGVGPIRVLASAVRHGNGRRPNPVPSPSLGADDAGFRWRDA